MVDIFALPSDASCLKSLLFLGSSAIADERAVEILLRSSEAAARVNVTISSLEMSAGASLSVSKRIILSIRTVVFPEPAAADMSRVLSLSSIAFN
jgi:hypothetical protein